MIDNDGFRANVGIVLINGRAQAFWGRRVGMSAWQFPQGGIQKHETPTVAMFRELEEEVGLGSQHVELIGCTQGWLRYRLPKNIYDTIKSQFVLVRNNAGSCCVWWHRKLMSI